MSGGKKVMYGKILVPLDGSERAERVLPYVEDLARQFKSEVLLLIVIEAVPEPLGPGQGSLPIQPDTHDPAYRSSRTYLRLAVENRGDFEHPCAQRERCCLDCRARCARESLPGRDGQPREKRAGQIVLRKRRRRSAA